MSRQEKKNYIPVAEALKEWLYKDMTAGPLDFNLLPQAAPNRHINVYRVEAADGTLFVKVYLDTPDVAEREVENYQYFKDLSFVPTMKHQIFPTNMNKRLIAYEFIEGEDLHRRFTAARQIGQFFPESIVLRSIDQISRMGDAVQPYDSILPKKLPWPLRTPIRRDFISKDIEEKFLAEYAPVFNSNKRIIELFPGYYFDRNPRNLMYDANGVHQVDFGVIERSSPVFDLIKLLRNGTDIILAEDVDLHTITADSQHIEQISTYQLSKERMFLRYAYDNYASKRKLNSDATFEAFEEAYQIAAIHSHFFYMTKYLRMLRDGAGEQNKLVSRCIYHIGMGRNTLNQMELLGYSFASLDKWIDYFISEGVQRSRLD